MDPEPASRPAARALAFLHRPGVNRTTTLVAVAAILVIARGAAAGTPSLPAPKVPAKDRFTGHVSRATGAFASDRGRVSIYLEPRSPGAATRQVTILIRPQSCPGAGDCVKLTGELTGTMTALPTHPDVGSSYRIKAAGKITPLGAMTATGFVHGTGFIERGVETLAITVGSARGSVGLDARSGAVRAFTSP